MTKYRLTPSGLSGQVFVIRNTDAASIPSDLDNRDYREYLEWVDGGGIPDLAPIAPTPTPPSGDFVAAIEKVADAAGLTTAETVALFGPPAI